MAPQSKVVLLDEPFADLDPASQIFLKWILRDINEQQEITVLLLMYSLNPIIEIESHVILLEEDRIRKDIVEKTDWPGFKKEWKETSR